MSTPPSSTTVSLDVCERFYDYGQDDQMSTRPTQGGKNGQIYNKRSPPMSNFDYSNQPTTPSSPIIYMPIPQPNGTPHSHISRRHRVLGDATPPSTKAETGISLTVRRHHHCVVCLRCPSPMSPTALLQHLHASHSAQALQHPQWFLLHERILMLQRLHGRSFATYGAPLASSGSAWACAPHPLLPGPVLARPPESTLTPSAAHQPPHVAAGFAAEREGIREGDAGTAEGLLEFEITFPRLSAWARLQLGREDAHEQEQEAEGGAGESQQRPACPDATAALASAVTARRQQLERLAELRVRWRWRGAPGAPLVLAWAPVPVLAAPYRGDTLFDGNCNMVSKSTSTTTIAATTATAPSQRTSVPRPPAARANAPLAFYPYPPPPGRVHPLPQPTTSVQTSPQPPLASSPASVRAVSILHSPQPTPHTPTPTRPLTPAVSPARTPTPSRSQAPVVVPVPDAVLPLPLLWADACALYPRLAAQHTHAVTAARLCYTAAYGHSHTSNGTSKSLQQDRYACDTTIDTTLTALTGGVVSAAGDAVRGLTSDLLAVLPTTAMLQPLYSVFETIHSDDTPPITESNSAGVEAGRAADATVTSALYMHGRCGLGGGRKHALELRIRSPAKTLAIVCCAAGPARGMTATADEAYCAANAGVDHASIRGREVEEVEERWKREDDGQGAWLWTGSTVGVWARPSQHTSAAAAPATTAVPPIPPSRGCRCAWCASVCERVGASVRAPTTAESAVVQTWSTFRPEEAQRDCGGESSLTAARPVAVVSPAVDVQGQDVRAVAGGIEQLPMALLRVVHGPTRRVCTHRHTEAQPATQMVPYECESVRGTLDGVVEDPAHKLSIHAAPPAQAVVEVNMITDTAALTGACGGSSVSGGHVGETRSGDVCLSEGVWVDDEDAVRCVQRKEVEREREESDKLACNAHALINEDTRHDRYVDDTGVGASEEGEVRDRRSYAEVLWGTTCASWRRPSCPHPPAQKAAPEKIMVFPPIPLACSDDYRGNTCGLNAVRWSGVEVGMGVIGGGAVGVIAGVDVGAAWARYGEVGATGAGMVDAGEGDGTGSVAGTGAGARVGDGGQLASGEGDGAQGGASAAASRVRGEGRGGGGRTVIGRDDGGGEQGQGGGREAVGGAATRRNKRRRGQKEAGERDANGRERLGESVEEEEEEEKGDTMGRHTIAHAHTRKRTRARASAGQVVSHAGAEAATEPEGVISGSSGRAVAGSSEARAVEVPADADADGVDAVIAVIPADTSVPLNRQREGCGRGMRTRSMRVSRSGGTGQEYRQPAMRGTQEGENETRGQLGASADTTGDAGELMPLCTAQAQQPPFPPIQPCASLQAPPLALLVSHLTTHGCAASLPPTAVASAQATRTPARHTPLPAARLETAYISLPATGTAAATIFTAATHAGNAYVSPIAPGVLGPVALIGSTTNPHSGEAHIIAYNTAVASASGSAACTPLMRPLPFPHAPHRPWLPRAASLTPTPASPASPAFSALAAPTPTHSSPPCSPHGELQRAHAPPRPPDAAGRHSTRRGSSSARPAAGDWAEVEEHKDSFLLPPAVPRRNTDSDARGKTRERRETRGCPGDRNRRDGTTNADTRNAPRRAETHLSHCPCIREGHAHAYEPNEGRTREHALMWRRDRATWLLPADGPLTPDRSHMFSTMRPVTIAQPHSRANNTRPVPHDRAPMLHARSGRVRGRKAPGGVGVGASRTGTGRGAREPIQWRVGGALMEDWGAHSEEADEDEEGMEEGDGSGDEGSCEWESDGSGMGDVDAGQAEEQKEPQTTEATPRALSPPDESEERGTSHVSLLRRRGQSMCAQCICRSRSLSLPRTDAAAALLVSRDEWRREIVRTSDGISMHSGAGAPRYLLASGGGPAPMRGGVFGDDVATGVSSLRRKRKHAAMVEGDEGAEALDYARKAAVWGRGDAGAVGGLGAGMGTVGTCDVPLAYGGYTPCDQMLQSVHVSSPLLLAHHAAAMSPQLLPLAVPAAPTAPITSITVLHILIKHTCSRNPTAIDPRLNRLQPVTRSPAQAAQTAARIRYEFNELCDAGNVSDVARRAQTFALFVQEHSECPSRTQRGAVEIAAGDGKVSHLWPQLSRLELGEVSPVIDTASGVHLFLRVG